MKEIIRIDNIRRSAPRRAQNNRNYEFEISSRRGSEGNGEPKRAHVIPPLRRSSPHSKVVPSLPQKPASTDFGNRQNEGSRPAKYRRIPMPTYISLISFTQKGVESIKDGPKRLDAAKERFRAAGARLKAFYPITCPHAPLAIS